jgi:hypothetical protein
VEEEICRPDRSLGEGENLQAGYLLDPCMSGENPQLRNLQICSSFSSVVAPPYTSGSSKSLKCFEKFVRSNFIAEKNGKRETLNN